MVTLQHNKGCPQGMVQLQAKDSPHGPRQFRAVCLSCDAVESLSEAQAKEWNKTGSIVITNTRGRDTVPSALRNLN